MGSTTPTVRYVVVDLPAEEIGDGTCLRSDKPIRVLFGFIVICTMLTMDDGALNWVPNQPPQLTLVCQHAYSQMMTTHTRQMALSYPPRGYFSEASIAHYASQEEGGRPYKLTSPPLLP